MVKQGIGKALDAFRAYRPSDWVRARNSVTTTVVRVQRPRRSGFDLLKFIQTGIAAAGLTASAAASPLTEVPLALETHTVEFVLSHVPATESTQAFHFRSGEHKAATFRQQSLPLPSPSHLASPIASLATFRAGQLAWEWASAAGPARRHGEDVATTDAPKADVRILFEPSLGTRAQIDSFAEGIAHAGIKEILAFENEMGELIIEAGPASRSLTFILKATRTLAIYRLATVAGATEVRTQRLPAKPSFDEIFTIAKSYVNSLWPSKQT